MKLFQGAYRSSKLGIIKELHQVKEMGKKWGNFIEDFKPVFEAFQFQHMARWEVEKILHPRISEIFHDSFIP